MIDFGQDVVLRRIHNQSLEHLIIFRNNFSIRKWCRQKDLIHTLEQDLWYERQASDPSIEMYSVLNKEKYFVGVVGLTDIDMHNGSAEFSCYIIPSEQGKGYGKKALITLFNHGFHNRRLNRIWGETFDGNPAASMFEKLGMVKEGTLRQTYFKSGKFLDSHMYGLLVEDWVKMAYSKKEEVIESKLKIAK